MAHGTTRRGSQVIALTAGLLLAVAVPPVSAAPGNPADDAVRVVVLADDADGILLQLTLNRFNRESVLIGDMEWTKVTLGKESPILAAGAPDLPKVCRSLIIPDDTDLAIRVVSAQCYDIADIDIVSSKGSLLRTVDPEKVPYEFGEAYATDAFYPGDLAVLREPYILRDYRGVVAVLYPFQYNPVTRTLRVYTEMVVQLVPAGPAQVNALAPESKPNQLSLAFDQIYRNHFINYVQHARYTPLNETGGMLIIANDAWLPNVLPLVNHKNAIGIPTGAVGVSSIGNNSTAIKAFIQNVYNQGGLGFVLLVGDATQVRPPTASGGSADPTYALLAGGDHYPDILVGRFSAENAAQVDTQVLRTIEYELSPAVDQPWFKRGTGIASTEGPGDDGEYDYQHIENIRLDLLAYGYAPVDQLYGSVSVAQVASAINAGRGIINYCGHGATTYWVTSGFSVTDVNNLVNDNMLPFIFDVACVNGQFDGYTCFAEAWLRASHNGEPTGAIGMYASSINQYWDEPMAAQDESVDLLCAEAYFSFGALCYAGSCLMMDEYGSSGQVMYDTWHVFGDPSVRVFGYATPPTGLEVTPEDDWSSSGPGGGPFTPGSHVYTLENLNDTPLDYTVTKDVNWLSITNASGTLPAHGTVNVTVSVNTMANFLANGAHNATVSFVNTTDHDGDTTRGVTLQVGVTEAQYVWNLNTNPGWTCEGAWAWGQPTGSGGQRGGPDPTSGHTGNYVYGYNLTGDYSNFLPERHLTSTAIDCSNLSDVTLKFWRWLGVEDDAYDHAYVRISTDGTNWTTLWENTQEISDTAWQLMEFDVSAIADGAQTVYLRWTMGATDYTNRYCGWNVDDVEIWGIADWQGYPAGDANCDGAVNSGDIPAFVLAITDIPAYQASYPNCDRMLADVNGDGLANAGDIPDFVDLLTGG